MFKINVLCHYLEIADLQSKNNILCSPSKKGFKKRLAHQLRNIKVHIQVKQKKPSLMARVVELLFTFLLLKSATKGVYSYEAVEG